MLHFEYNLEGSRAISKTGDFNSFNQSGYNKLRELE